MTKSTMALLLLSIPLNSKLTPRGPASLGPYQEQQRQNSEIACNYKAIDNTKITFD